MRFSDVILRGIRADQPSFLVAPVGALYFVTDENVIERNAGTSWQSYSASVSGFVTGPASAVDEALVRFDATTGKLVQNSLITLTDAGVLSFPDNVRQIFNPGANNPGLNIGSHAGDPSTPSNGDVWYNSTTNEFKARINGATVVLGVTSDLFPRKTYQARATAENAVNPFVDWGIATNTQSLAGTQSQPGSDAAGTWLRNTSGAVAGNSSGIRWHTTTSTEELTAGFALPRVRFKIRTGASVAACRFLVGLRIAAATPATDVENNFCLVRFSTNVPDAGWVGVTVDNVGNVNTSPMILAIAINTVYEIEVKYMSATEVKFTVNGTSQTITHATQIPTANITPHCTVTTLAAGAKVFDFSVMSLDSL